MRQTLILTLAAFSFYGCIADRNVPKPHSIAEALKLDNYKARLEGVRFYFGNQSHPEVEELFGVRTTARRRGMSDQDKNIAARVPLHPYYWC